MAAKKSSKSSSKASSKTSSNGAAKGAVAVLVGTRKGAFILRSDKTRRTWKTTGPLFLGYTVNHVVADPRNGKVILTAASTFHIGPTVYRSTDGGKTWKEASQPPAFPKAPEGVKGRVVGHVFWLTPGHANEKNVWYAGTSPQGLFRSEDNGDTWQPVSGFNDHPMLATWTGGEQDGTPDGPKMHSINIDPRDANHIYIGMSGGGVFESTDKGATWTPLNKGCVMDFSPVPDPEYGHDPHHMQLHPLMPDRLYQQNHCGIYRMDRPEGRWVRIGDNMPKKVGDIGFPITLHPRDPDTVWVFPMDGTSVWPRTSPEGKPATYISRNAGNSWKRQDKGLPKNQAWFTVKRQAMANDAHDPVGLYFGTTSGEIWASRNEGESWSPIAQHLPEIYSIEVQELGR
jgi:photosystem II stability/assembly factor-like uncharacterized protein